jgi:hypothetical protein
MTLVPKVVETYSLLLRVEVDDGREVVRVLALVPARAHAFREIEADLRLALL